MTDVVNVGTTDNDGNGDTLRAAFSQINIRFNELLSTIDGGDAWATGVTYTATPIRQWVIESGQAYVAAVNHVSGASFAADLSAGKWFAVDSAQILSDLAGTNGASLIGYLPPGAGAVTTTVDEELNGLQVSALRFMTTAQKNDVQNRVGALDVSAAVQLAIDYLGTLGGGTLICPGGLYKLSTALVPCNFLTVKGDTATILNGVSPAGTMFIVANSTAAFTAPYIQKLRFENVGFAADGVGVGMAYAYLQTTITAYSERCEFDNVNVWANMAGGFLGNFILTTWRRCEFGYYSTPVGQFWPIYSKGNISGNQTNANLLEDCYILNSLGSYTVYFEAGSDLTLRNCRFEHCDAATTVNMRGILVTIIENCYFEDSNGAGTLSLINYENDTTNAQGCSTIIFNGNYGSLSSNNTHLISHGGASGSPIALGNRFEGLSGKQFMISQSGNNKPFAAYLGNETPGFDGVRVNIASTAGTWTPAIFGTSGTNAHTYSVQSGKYTRVGRLVTAHFRVTLTSLDAGSGGYLSVELLGLPTPDTAPSEGWTGTLNYTNGVTYPAGTTQLGIAVSNITAGKASLIASGSGTVVAAVPTTSFSGTGTIVGCLVYETADA